MLKRFTPHELGLSNPEVKPIRGGAIVLSLKREGLQTLQAKIEKDPEMKHKVEAKISVRKPPQISILGVDERLQTRNLRQKSSSKTTWKENPRTIRVLISFAKQETKTHIVEVTPTIFKQLKERKRLLIGWTSCPDR
ncbi:uncharacterized protein ISCGN_014771 [Ixodes scapularis]